MATFNVRTDVGELGTVIETARTEPVFLESAGRRVGVVVSPERYAQLMDALDDLADVAAFDDAMAEPGPNIAWTSVQVDPGRP